MQMQGGRSRDHMTAALTHTRPHTHTGGGLLLCCFPFIAGQTG